MLHTLKVFTVPLVTQVDVSWCQMTSCHRNHIYPEFLFPAFPWLLAVNGCAIFSVTLITQNALVNHIYLPKYICMK